MAYVTEKRGVHDAVIYEGRNPVSGRERRRWHRCDNRRDAERLAGRLSADHDRRHRTGSSMTLGDFLLGQWLPAREATVARSTFARDAKAIEHYLLPHLGDTPLRRLRAEHIRALCQRLLITGSRRGGPLAAKTIANLHQLLRSALGAAVDRGLLLSNPAAEVHPPNPRNRPSGRRRAKSWTAAELGAFLDETAQSQYSMLFRLTAATGMRRGEVLGLRWDDIHFDTGRIEITQALIAIDYQLEFSRLKTRTSRRKRVSRDPWRSAAAVLRRRCRRGRHVPPQRPPRDDLFRRGVRRARLGRGHRRVRPRRQPPSGLRHIHWPLDHGLLRGSGRRIEQCCRLAVPGLAPRHRGYRHRGRADLPRPWHRSWLEAITHAGDRWWFFSPYNHPHTIYEWRMGPSKVHEVGIARGPLRGLPGRRFLDLGGDGPVVVSMT